MSTANGSKPLETSSPHEAIQAQGSTKDSPFSAAPSDNELDEKMEKTVVDQLQVGTAVFWIILIFSTSLCALLLVYCSFPTLDESEAQHLKFPKDIDDAKQLGLLLSRYKDKYYAEVIGGVFITYLFLQTFAIPGSIFLSIVSGYLFPFPIALSLVCFCSATGASFCYLLSFLAGRPLVHKYLPKRAEEWSRKVEKQKSNIFSYILFLRITPLLPNWFINLVSPVVGVRLLPFWFGTFFGVAPPSFIAIQAGTTLQQLTSGLDAVTLQSVALLVLFAFLSILPVLLKNRKGLKAYFSGIELEDLAQDCKSCSSCQPLLTSCASRRRRQDQSASSSVGRI